MTRPRIGITANLEPDEFRRNQPRCHVNAAYVDAVFAAGGLPLVLPPPPVAGAPARPDPTLFEELLGACDGLLFTGGPDLDPAHYDQPRHPLTRVLPERRNWFEVDFFRRAVARQRPILAICLGCQVANVAAGGGLIQHVDDLPRNPPVEHYRPDHSSAYHAVEVAPDSLLARIIGRTSLEVNSRHHQVLDRGRIGGRLRPVAFAPDGVIEAAEDPQSRFLVAVQWHPEDLLDRPEQLRLFEALVMESRAARESQKDAGSQ